MKTAAGGVGVGAAEQTRAREHRKKTDVDLTTYLLYYTPSTLRRLLKVSQTEVRATSLCPAGRTKGRLHVEKHIFNVARFVEMLEALGEAFDIAFQKNEAMIGGLPGNTFVFVELEEGGGVFEGAALALGAGGLDLAERI